jgi:hypothetical protein
LHNKKLEQKEQVISSLEEQITKAQYEQSTLTKQLADITQERDSLILAFSLITDDKPSGQDYEYSCKTFKKPKRNVKNVKSTGKPADVASCVCRNRYSVLEDNILLDPNESNENNVDELNESKRDETQHKERPVTRDNAVGGGGGGGGGTKGKAELL